MDYGPEAMWEITFSTWDRIVGEIAGGEKALTSARKRWVSAFVEGHDWRPVEKEIRRDLLRSRWDWPWHREWFDRFSSMKMWPRMWGPTSSAVFRIDRGFTHCETKREREAEKRSEIENIRENMGELLFHTIARSSFQERDRRKVTTFKAMVGAGRGWSWELLSDMEPPAVVEAVIDPLRSEFTALYPLESGPRPPFFPGDTTSVRSVPPPRLPTSS